MLIFDPGKTILDIGCPSSFLTDIASKKWKYPSSSIAHITFGRYCLVRLMLCCDIAVSWPHTALTPFRCPLFGMNNISNNTAYVMYIWRQHSYLSGGILRVSGHFSHLCTSDYAVSSSVFIYPSPGGLFFWHDRHKIYCTYS